MDDDGSIPPAYALNDPLPLNSPYTHHEVGARHRLSPREQDAPSYGHVAQSETGSGFSSAADYFEDNQPALVFAGQEIARHSLTFNPSSKRGELDSVPVCWLVVGASDITDLDMKTFSNYLFPASTSTKTQASGFDAETWTSRKNRMVSVAAEWNEGFFSLRGLYVHFFFDDNVETTSKWCASCKAATRDTKDPSFASFEATSNPAKPTAAAQIKRAAGLFAQHVVKHIEESNRAQANRRLHNCPRVCHSHGHYPKEDGAINPHPRHPFFQPSQSSQPSQQPKPSRCSKASKPSKPSAPHSDLNPVSHLLQTLSLQNPSQMSRSDRADLRTDLKDVRREFKSAVSEVRAQKRAEGRELRGARRCRAGGFIPAAPLGGSLVGDEMSAQRSDGLAAGNMQQPLGWQRGERRELKTWRRDGLREIRGVRRELIKEERCERRGRGRGRHASHAKHAKHGLGGFDGEGESDGAEA